MFPINPHPLISLLLTFLLVSSISSSLSHADSHPQFHQTRHYHGMVDEGEYGVVSWGMKTSVLEGTNGETVENSSMVLAAKRTYRRDPSDNFNFYKGGWNISHNHYLSSVAFTGSPLFVIAALWLLGFGLCLLFICLYHCCCRRRRYGYSRTAYALSLIFLTLFTIAAIVGCIVLYTGQGKFHSSTTNTLNYVVKEADGTVETLRNVSDYLAAAKRIGVDQTFLPSNVLNNIDKIDSKINASSYTLENKTAKNKSDIQDVLEAVQLALIIIAAVMLLLALIGFAFSILGMQFIVNILVVVGWILVAGTFILCGLFLVLHKERVHVFMKTILACVFSPSWRGYRDVVMRIAKKILETRWEWNFYVAADTCVAMDQWLQHPMAHTALDEILPCVDNATSQETLFQSKDVTYQLVGMINLFINISNSNIPFGPLYYNQSGPSVPVLCNPFHPDKSDRECASGEVELSNATQEWKKYVCQVSETGNCSTVGRLTPTFYDQMSAAVNVSYALYSYGPFLVELQDCSFVRKTFTVIHKDHCPGLRRYSQWIYIGLVMVSTAVMLSLVFWVLYARERRHRVYTKQVREAPTQDLVGQKGP